VQTDLLQRRLEHRLSIDTPQNEHKHLLAFTRVELIVCVGALALLASVVAPALASNRNGSDRAVCQNNLRLIGQAIHSWAGDHDGNAPWWTPVRKGGTYRTSRPGNAWYEYLTLTNELSSPNVLACPADANVRQASTWADLIEQRQNSISYSLWVHASAESPRGILSSDLNFRRDPGTVSCSAGYVNLYLVLRSPSSVLAWTNRIHGDAGNLLLFDGTIEFTDTARLRELLTNSAAAFEPQALHVISAR
jgi:type II secretory pathway pseudopilin PulG